MSGWFFCCSKSTPKADEASPDAGNGTVEITVEKTAADVGETVVDTVVSVVAETALEAVNVTLAGEADATEASTKADNTGTVEGEPASVAETALEAVSSVIVGESGTAETSTEPEGDNGTVEAVEAESAEPATEEAGSAVGGEGDAAETAPEVSTTVEVETVSVEPTQEELDDLSKACSKLWELDTNRLTPGVDYEINLQGGTRVHRRDDAAEDPLFSRVNEEVFERPTFKAFCALLDNYERETGVAETVSREEREENTTFLNTIMDTPVMQYLQKYLVATGHSSEERGKFFMQLHHIWFSLYRRQVRNDSSGFEHVFVGEEKDGAITGFHNWIQFYLEERKGNLDYKGYILPRRRGREPAEAPDGTEQLITVQFSWTDEQDGSEDTKPVSSTLVGVSPEFELALYTLCFLAGEETNRVEMGAYELIVKCYKINSRQGPRIGSSFPQAL